MRKSITNTWGRSVLNGYLLNVGTEDGQITKAYIKGMLDALDVAYAINECHSNYVDIRVDCDDTRYAIIMAKIDKFYLEG